MPNWRKLIVSGSDATLRSLNVTTAFTASGLIYPTIDGTVNQAIVTDGLGNLSFDNPYSSNTVVYGKNLSGTTILKGTPLYFTGSGTSGNLVGVLPADAGNPARMPAAGVAGEELLNAAEGVILLDGFINGVDTSAFSSGDPVYVAVGGGYTNVKPTGSTILIQALGYVERSAVNGSGVIQGSGRANDVPNIQQGYSWVGNANGVATPTPTSSFSVANAVSASFATTASYALNAEESVFTAIVTNSGASNYIIDGVAKPILTFIPGASYRFDTSGVIGTHPFRFSLSPNGPTQYTDGVTIGTNFIQIDVDYSTSQSLYYYCTIHSGMGNEANVLRQENLVETTTFNTFSTNVNSHISSTNIFTGSIQTQVNNLQAATSSYVTNSQTSSMSVASASIAQTASFAQNAVSASFALTASSADNFTVRNTITAQTLVVQTITSSVVYSSGSNIFGNDLSNTQVLTGSVLVTGSLAVNNSNVIVSSQTSSMSVATASVAQTASYVTLAQTASYVENAQTASFALNAVTASFITGSNVYGPFGSNSVISSSFALTASFALNGGGSTDTGSLLTTGSVSGNVLTFTKGDSTTFNLTVDTGSGGVSTDTGSLLTTGSVLGNVLTFTKGDSTTFNLTIDTGSGTTNTGSLLTTGSVSGNVLTFTKGDDTTFNLTIDTGSGTTNTGSLLTTGSVSGNVLTFTKGDSTTFSLTVNTGSGTTNTGSLLTTGSVVGNVLTFTKGDSTTFSLTVATGSGGGGGGGATVTHTQLTASNTWTFNHSLNTLTPLLQVYDLGYEQIIPNEIVSIDAFTSEIRFDYTQAGYAVASSGGGLVVTGSTPRLVQTVAATTWSFAHNLGTQFPGFEVFDQNDYVVIPAGIYAIDENNAEIYFATPSTGVAIANFSGIGGVGFVATSASYAATASYSDQFNIGQTQTQYATVTSSINGSNTVFNQATGSYTSAFFKYTVTSGSNARSGEIMSVWNGTTAAFTDNSTTDIGTTTDVTSSVEISGANVRLNMQTNSSGWKVKSIATFM
jgi:hypothetical protein